MNITTNVELTKGGTTKGVTFEVTDFNGLTDIILNEQYSLSTFKDGIVTKENFKSARAIGLDFDEGYTLKQAKEDFVKFKCMIATTKSHHKKKHGKIQDRFRVILFLSEPINDIKVFYATYKKLQDRFIKLDKHCKNPNRWFYPSKDVVMVNKDGIKVVPVTNVKPKEVDNTEYLKIGKGKLSKDTRKFLHRGIPAGERNGTVFKIAKDFQENNFSEDDAIKYIVRALNQNETIGFDFTDDEVEAAIRSAYSSEPTNGPRQPFKLMPLTELYKISTKMEWAVERLMSKGGISLWSAPPKLGKSWLARQLITDLLCKRPFLDRKTLFGEVHYYAIEEQAEVVKKSFKKLGLPEQVPLYIHVGDIFSDDALTDFKKILMDRKPVLAVIDTLFDFLDVESENNYKEVKVQLRRLREIARSSGTHILCIHHANKSNMQGVSGSNRTVLGSAAIAGGVDAIVVLEMSGQDRIITATGRMVRPITLRKLDWNRETWTYSLGEAVEPEQF